jgi:hypothetical protein
MKCKRQKNKRFDESYLKSEKDQKLQQGRTSTFTGGVAQSKGEKHNKRTYAEEDEA